MIVNNHIDLELSKMLRKEQEKLKEYEEMFDYMTAAEKEELREWMAQGKSVNSNPYLLYEENGCLMDLITASRIDDDMMCNPEDYFTRHEAGLYDEDDGEELPF